MNIKIPVAFVAIGDSCLRLMTAEERRDAEKAKETGTEVQKAAAVYALELDDDARALDGVFDGVALFERPTTLTRDRILATAMAQVEEEMAAEPDRARAVQRNEHTEGAERLLAIRQFRLAPELTFAGLQGEGADLYGGWNALPEDIRDYLAGRLQHEYAGPSAVMEAIKKKRESSQKRKAR